MIAGGERLGCLSLYAAEPNTFNENTIDQYTDLANNLAYGVTALRTKGERERAVEALRDSEQRLQDIVDNTTAVIFVKDLELRYQLINREYERHHSVMRDQICGKTDFDIHPQDVAEAVRANDRQVIAAGEPIQFEEAVPSSEGERHYIVSKFLLRDRAGKPYAVCGIAADITQMKHAEAVQRRRAYQAAMSADIQPPFPTKPRAACKLSYSGAQNRSCATWTRHLPASGFSTNKRTSWNCEPARANTPIWMANTLAYP